MFSLSLSFFEHLFVLQFFDYFYFLFCSLNLNLVHHCLRAIITINFNYESNFNRFAFLSLLFLFLFVFGFWIQSCKDNCIKTLTLPSFLLFIIFSFSFLAFFVNKSRQKRNFIYSNFFLADPYHFWPAFFFRNVNSLFVFHFLKQNSFPLDISFNL